MIADTAEKQGICGLAHGDCSNLPNDLVRLEELGQFEVAEHEADPRGWELVGRDGGKRSGSGPRRFWDAPNEG